MRYEEKMGRAFWANLKTNNVREKKMDPNWCKTTHSGKWWSTSQWTSCWLCIFFTVLLVHRPFQFPKMLIHSFIHFGIVWCVHRFTCTNFPSLLWANRIYFLFSMLFLSRIPIACTASVHKYTFDNILRHRSRRTIFRQIAKYHFHLRIPIWTKSIHQTLVLLHTIRKRLLNEWTFSQRTTDQTSIKANTANQILIYGEESNFIKDKNIYMNIYMYEYE